jgi:hypothetical protein
LPHFSITFKVNKLQRNWNFPLKPVSETVRISKAVESGLLKTELKEEIDGSKEK